MEPFWLEISSPVGKLVLTASDKALTGVRFEKGKGAPRPNAVLREAEKQIREYFAGKRREFDLPCAAKGTDFQRQVWRALQAVGYGETRTYGQIARAIRRAGAARAVGAACGRNPLAIVIPCHRVMGADGSLTGFGGGVGIKKRLLEHESEKK